jgi:hypothetical protein
MRALVLLLHALRASAQVPSLEALGAAWLPRNESIGNMPSVTNFWGSATVSTDPLDALGLDTFDAFPHVGWLRTRLSAVDATGAQRYFSPNASRWYAHRTERTASAGGGFAAVSATVSHRFLFETSSTLIMLTLRNGGAEPVALRALNLLVWAGVRMVSQMSWVVPLPADDGSWACGVLPAGDGTPVLRFLDAISPARLVVATAPSPSAFSTFGYAFGKPGLETCGGNASFGDVTLAAGAEWTLALGAVPGIDSLNATAPLLGLLADPGVAAAASDAAWQQRWEAAFVPNNGHFSGNAPVLTEGTPSAVSGFYYMSVLTLISVERTNWRASPIFVDCPRLYPIGHGGLAGGGAPGGRPLGGSAYWIWDESYATLTLALLDPAALRAYLRVVLAELQWTTTNALDLMTAAPIFPWPNGFGGGGGYYFNALQLFTAVSNYVATTNDTAFLDERVGPHPQERVVDKLLSFALHWRDFDPDLDFLAEYSADDSNYLECVPHYRGAVAALQGGSVFMMRSAASLLERLYAGDATLPTPTTLRALATNVSTATVARLYLPGEGYWATFSNTTLSRVPTVVDFAHVGRFLRGDLSGAAKGEANAFFFSQLLFPEWTGWLRALAEPDGGGSQRADHGTTGAYTTWAALSIESAAFNDGGWERALPLFSRFSPLLRLGPLGQAGQVQVIGANDTALHTVFKAPQWPFVNVAGASFADVVLRSLFGFAPGWAPTDLSAVQLSPPLAQGGFVGSLAHVRTPLGRLAGVDSDGSALTWAFE